MMGVIITMVVIVIDLFIIKSTINEYKRMSNAKRKAMIWDARIK